MPPKLRTPTTRSIPTSIPVSAKKLRPTNQKTPSPINLPVWLDWQPVLKPAITDVAQVPMFWPENRHRVLTFRTLPMLSVPVGQRSPYRRKKRYHRYHGFLGEPLPQPSGLKQPMPWVDPAPDAPLYRYKRWPIVQSESTSSQQSHLSAVQQWRTLASLARNVGISSERRQHLLRQIQKLVRLGRHQQALSLCEKVLREEPEDIETLQTSARIAIWLKQWGRVKNYMQRWLDVAPGDVEGYRIMGDWQRASGHPEVAVSWYVLYLRIVPHDQEVWRILARTAAQARQPQLARKMYQQILRKHPGDREAKAYLANETLLPRFLISLTTTQQLFTRDRIGQYFEPKFGMRFFNRLLVLVGLGIDLRHFATYTSYDLFPHVEAVWLSPHWKDFKANLFVGGTPLRSYYPHFLLESGATVPVWKLRFHGAYRYTYFAERQAHLFVPGVSLVWEPFLFGVQYYLTLVQDADAKHLQAQHSVRFRARWQPLWWLVIRGGIGGGDTPDYLLNILNLPQNGPSAGTEIFAQSIFFFDLNFQFELPHSQFLLFTYRYYQELLFLFPNTPADRAIFLHELSLAYRWYF